MQIKQLFDLFGFAYIIIGVIVTIINIINIVTWSPVISVKDSEEKQKLKRGKSKDEIWENLSKRNEVAYDINELRGMLIILKRKEEGGNIRRKEGGNVRRQEGGIVESKQLLMTERVATS